VYMTKFARLNKKPDYFEKHYYFAEKSRFLFLFFLKEGIRIWVKSSRYYLSLFAISLDLGSKKDVRRSKAEADWDQKASATIDTNKFKRPAKLLQKHLF
jgi:hypothetical protein